MPSIGVPQTQCVYIFNGELEQLKRYQKDIENGLISQCCLYGLWTHSSNVVIHLVVSNETERSYVQSHQLDCVGYMAKAYDSVKSRTNLSTKRQHIIVDINETVKTGSLQAFASQSGSLGQKQYLQVNVLSHESPFRNELWKRNPEMKAVMNACKSESENDSRSYSEVPQASHKLSNEGNENHQNGPAVKANIHENSIKTSEIDPYHGNQINGYQSKKNEINTLIHKIKHDFAEPVEERQKSSLVLYFQHGGKQWQIKIKENQGKTFVEISFFSEHPKHEELPKACRREFDTSKTVIDKIKELCMCEKCITK